MWNWTIAYLLVLAFAIVTIAQAGTGWSQTAGGMEAELYVLSCGVAEAPNNTHARRSRRTRASARTGTGSLGKSRIEDNETRSEWEKMEFSSTGEIQAFADEARAAFCRLDMNHDVEWLATAHGWPQNELLVMSDREGSALKGIATFLVSRAPLVYSLGSLVLARQSVRQLKLFQGMTSSHRDRASAIDKCLNALSKVIAGSDVIFIGAIPIGSELHQVLRDRHSLARRAFHILPWGGETQHCRIRWSGNYEQYLASLGKVTRKDLRRSSRALFSNPSLKCEVRRFQTPHDVETFLSDGIEISDKTYQKRDLGLGIRRGDAVERVIRFAAARNAFLGYILYINGAPAAFEYAFVCGGTCTMKQAGYDPVWARHHIGSVLFCEVLRDFERIGLAADRLDLMPDINLFKLRTTNEKAQIQHAYLFPKTLTGTVRFAALSLIDAVSRAIRPLIKRARGDELDRYLARASRGWSNAGDNRNNET